MNGPACLGKRYEKNRCGRFHDFIRRFLTGFRFCINIILLYYYNIVIRTEDTIVRNSTTAYLTHISLFPPLVAMSRRRRKTGALTFRKQNKSHLKVHTLTQAHNTLWGHLSLEVLHCSSGQTTGYISIGSGGHVQIVIVIGPVILFFFVLVATPSLLPYTHHLTCLETLCHNNSTGGSDHYSTV